MRTPMHSQRIDNGTLWTVTALLIGSMAAILVATMVNLAVPTLASDFNAATTEIQWVTTAYLLAMASAIPTSGWLESRWGGKSSWMLAMSLFLVGTLLCACSWNLASLIVFRALQGFGGGLIFPIMQTLCVRAVGGSPTPRLMATVSLPMALGPILGPVIAGIVLNWLGWRWLFVSIIPIIVMGMMLSARYVPRDDPAKRTESHALDAVGLLLLSPGLTMLLLALSNIARDAGIAHVGVILPSAIGLLFLGFFCLWALHGTTHPIVDIRLFRFRSLTGSCIVLVVSGAIMYAAMFLLPLYYQDLRGMSVLAAGLLMIPQGLGTLLSRFAAARLSDTLGARGFTVASLLLAAAAPSPSPMRPQLRTSGGWESFCSSGAWESEPCSYR